MSSSRFGFLLASKIGVLWVDAMFFVMAIWKPSWLEITSLSNRKCIYKWVKVPYFPRLPEGPGPLKHRGNIDKPWNHPSHLTNLALVSHGTKKSTPQRSLSLLTATLLQHISKELQGDVEIDNFNFNPPWDNLSVIIYQTCIHLSSFQSGS